MNETTKNAYPSRVEAGAAVLPRQEPTLHGGLDAPGPLSREQLTAFDGKGFCFLPEYLEEAEVADLRAETARLVSSEEIRQSEISITEPSSGRIRSVYGVTTVSKVFDRLARDARFVDAARQLLASDVYLHQTHVTYKPSFVGQEFYWHSDFETWHVEDGMPSMRALSVSIAF